VFHHVCEVEQHLIGDTRLLPIFSFSFWGSRVSRREGAGNSKRPSGVSSLYPPTSHFFPPAISIFISFFFLIEDDASLVSLKEKKKEFSIFSLDAATE
jgi:hypothetical protein